MAVSYQNCTTSITLGTTVSFSFDVGTGTDRALFCSAWGESNPSNITGVTYNSVSMSQIADVSWSRPNFEVFELANPASGSNTLAVTNSTYKALYIWAGCANGVDQTTPSDTATTNTGTGSTISTASTTCPTDGLVFGTMGHRYTSGSAAAITGTGNTLACSQRSAASGEGQGGGYRSSTGVVSWTISSSAGYAAVGIPVRAAAAGNPTASVPSGNLTLTAGTPKQTMLQIHKVPAHGT